MEVERLRHVRVRTSDVASELLAHDAADIPEHLMGVEGYVYPTESGVFHITCGDEAHRVDWGGTVFLGTLEQCEERLAWSLPPDEPPFFVVCVCLCDRAWGGPEEGGWWFDTTDPCLGRDAPLPRVTRTRAEAEAEADRMSDWCVDQNEGRPEINSVDSVGRYTVVMYEGEWPHATPTETPHYE